MHVCDTYRMLLFRRKTDLPHPSLGGSSFQYQKNKPVPPPPQSPSAPVSAATAPAPTASAVPPAPAYTPSQPPTATPPARTRTTRGGSFGFESDPWGSPEMHKGHNHGGSNGASQPNGDSASTSATLPPRTTSAFTTSSDRESASVLSGPPPVSNDPPSWGEYPVAGPSETGFRDSGLGAEGFGDSGLGGDPNPSRGLGRSLGANRVTSTGPEEVVTITSIPEKEGMFMFQHRNYEVITSRRNSKVIRRYSDFVWLLDCLHKRYPFRQLPLLPPKRVASKCSP